MNRARVLRGQEFQGYIHRAKARFHRFRKIIRAVKIRKQAAQLGGSQPHRVDHAAVVRRDVHHARRPHKTVSLALFPAVFKKHVRFALGDPAAFGKADRPVLGNDLRKRTGNAHIHLLQPLAASPFHVGYERKNEIGKFGFVKKLTVRISVVPFAAFGFENERTVYAPLSDNQGNIGGTHVQYRHALAPHTSSFVLHRIYTVLL